jgi:Tfp pilus assembly protein PilF
LLPLTLVLAFVAYSGTLGYEFVYDDDDQIIGNRYVTSWSYLPRYFTEHSWSHRDFNLPGNYYRPIVLVWLRLNYSLFGLHPALWHLITVLVYLGAVGAVYWLFRRLLQDKVTAGMAAMIFALCPLHIETAAWISGVTEPLLALLLIPSFLFYLNSRRGEEGPGNRSVRIKWIAASLAFYAAALFTKETAIILPAMIVAYELICDDKRAPKEGPETNSLVTRLKAFLWYTIKALVRIVPFAVVTLGYLVIRTIVLGGLLHTASRLSWMTRLLTVPSLLWGYLKLLVWPVGLSEFYDTPYVKSPGLVSFLLPLMAVVFAVTALWWAIKRVKNERDRRILAFACAWIVIPILPVLNIATFRPGDLIHDRYLFLPTIGFAVLLAYGLRKIRGGSGKLAGLPPIQALAALVLAGALGLATAYQHVYWANDIVLFHHSLSVAPGNAIAQNAFGNALSTRELYDEAITVLEHLVQQEPYNPTALYNLGYNYYKVGRCNEALPYLSAAVEINPKDERQFLTLGVTLFFLDKYDAAEGVLRQGIAVRRDGLGLHYALGAVLKQTGRLEEALNEFNQEVVYNPEYVSAYDQMNQIKQQMRNGTPRSGSPASGGAAEPR